VPVVYTLFEEGWRGRHKEEAPAAEA